MAVRSRLLLPDIAVRVASGEMEVVSRQAVLEAVADAVILQEMAGGFISVAVQRMPTGAPNEMVTVSAMVEWKDRSDAKTQPEARALEYATERELEEEIRAISRLSPEEIERQQVLRAENEEAASKIQARLEDDRRADVGDEGVAAAMRAGAENPVKQNSVLPFEHDKAESPDGLDESLLQDEDVPESVR